LWIGTYTAGVSVLNLTTNKFKHYLSNGSAPGELDGTSSYAIFKDRENRIWVTTMSGVNLYRRSEDCFTQVRDLGATTIDIDQDAKGYLWFSTQGRGLFKYEPQRDIWKNYTVASSGGLLLSDQVNCMQITSSGDMWIGTTYGLCKYNPQDDSFEPILLEIPSQNICGIVEDAGALWLTTTKGLVRYTKGEGCQVFTKSDGLLGEQFIPNAAIKASDGKIYVGSVNGFNSFYPHRIQNNTILPPVEITGLEVFNKEVKVGSELLPRSFKYMKKLELTHRENVFSLHFSALSYCIPFKNQYAYKLEGFDKEWSYVGNQTKATYTNLPAGRYLFRVKATNNDGIWNEEGVTLPIVIHPPFYLTNLFMMLYALIILFFLGLFIRVLLRRSEKRHTAEIDTLHEQKEKEVHEAKIQFFTMVAHEIRTPVSLIIAPMEKVMLSIAQFPVALRDDLTMIERNSQRLLFLVNQLLDFRKVEQDGMKLRCSSLYIGEFLKPICNRFRPSMEQGKIT
ncbi:MAG: ligand-binding sensor domain-containing protein, partial [Phocaeicola sp.]